MDTLFIPLSLAAGGLLAVQAGANAQLSKATASPFAATTIQVVLAALLLLIVAIATGTAAAFGGLRAVPWWHAVGGVATAFYVASTILVFPRLGAVVAVGLFIAGQMLASLGLNGLLRHDLGAPFVVGTISFAVATLSMIAVLLLTLLTGGAKPQLGGLRTMPWWGWIGAVCGATYVTTVFVAIPAIGTAATVGLTVAGQQIVSLFVDRQGWFRLPRREISTLRFAGVVVLLLGVAAIKVF